MNVLLYLEAGSENGGKVRNMIETVVPDENLSVYTKYMDMRRDLLDPFFRQHTIVVAAVDSYIQLSLMSDDHVLRDNHRLILVIPLQNEQAAMLGYHMKPRYIGDIEGPLDPVAEVVKKMAANVLSGEAGGRTAFA